jgi:hypothetical protein
VKSSVCIAILKPSPSSPRRYDDVRERERRRVRRALAHLVEVLLDRDAGSVHRDDERREAAVTLARVGLGEDDRPRGVARVRDERLRAVQDVLVAAPLGGGLDAGDVGAGVRLGQAERAEDRLLEERHEPFAPLFIGAGQQHGACPQRVRGERDGHARAAPGELLADQDPVERLEPEAAVLLGDVDVHQAELVRLRDDVSRVRLVLVVLGRLRPDLLLGELACERPQLLLLVGQRERNARLCCHRHRRSLVD